MDGDVIGKNYPASVPIVANPKEGLSQILSLVKGRDVHKGDGYQREVTSLKKKIYEGGRERMPNEMRAFDALRSVLPRDAVTCWYATVPLYRGVCDFPAYGPRTFMYAHGWAGLGFGFPASLGAKVAKPQTPGNLRDRRWGIPVQHAGAGHRRPVWNKSCSIDVQ